MIFVDTNYFLRFFLEDVKEQHLEVKKLFQEAALGKVELFTSVVVFFEIYWVLASFYEAKKDEVVETLKNFLALSFIGIEERNILDDTLAVFVTENISLEDCYNLTYARFKRAKTFKTFDKKLLKKFEIC